MNLTQKDFYKIADDLKASGHKDIAVMHIESEDGEMESYFTGNLEQAINILSGEVASIATSADMSVEEILAIIKEKALYYKQLTDKRGSVTAMRGE